MGTGVVMVNKSGSTFTRSNLRGYAAVRNSSLFTSPICPKAGEYLSRPQPGRQQRLPLLPPEQAVYSCGSPRDPTAVKDLGPPAPPSSSAATGPPPAASPLPSPCGLSSAHGRCCSSPQCAPRPLRGRSVFYSPR